ncbi:MAG: patatin-like phospholipase family protein [Rickettsiella sp.]|nr:patatin-like phospholipase family protein [Rickettsiella sp.]
MLDLSNTFDIENLVFEGGGAKGLAYVGVINALGELGIYQQDGYKIKKVAGTSAGSITALLISLDYSPEEIQKKLFNLDFNSLFEVSINYLKNVPNPTNWNGLKNFAEYINTIMSNYGKGQGGINSGDKFISWIEDIVSNSKYKNKLNANSTFSDLKNVTHHDLYVYGTRVFNSNQTIADFNAKETPGFSIVKAIRISMSIPFLFQSVLLEPEKEYYVDGGVVYNFPINFDDSNTEIHKTLGFSLHKLEQVNQYPEGDNIFNQIYLEAKALVEDIYSSEVWRYKKDEATNDRIVFMDTSFVSTLDFDMDVVTKKKLIANGHKETLSYFISRIKQQK